MPADENPEWSLVDFARQIAGMPKSAPEAAFNFTEPVPNGEKMDLPPASAKPTNMSAEDPPVSREQGPASAESQDTLRSLRQVLPEKGNSERPTKSQR